MVYDCVPDLTTPLVPELLERIACLEQENALLRQNSLGFHTLLVLRLPGLGLVGTILAAAVVVAAVVLSLSAG